MRGSVYSRFLLIFLAVALVGCASRNTPQTQLIRQASEYRQMMDRQRASADEEALKKVPPLTAEGYEKLGDQYFLQGKADIAFKNYYDALRLEPGQIRVRYKMGRLFLEKGLLEEAEKEFQGVLEKNPDYALAHEGLGRVYLGRKKLSGAEKEFARAVQLDRVYGRPTTFSESFMTGKENSRKPLSTTRRPLPFNRMLGFCTTTWVCPFSLRENMTPRSKPSSKERNWTQITRES